MRNAIISAAAAALALCAASAGASAQSVGVEVYAGPPAYERGYATDYYYAPPVYGYTRRYDDDAAEVTYTRRYRRDCGRYGYWEGGRCNDVRDAGRADQ